MIYLAHVQWLDNSLDIALIVSQFQLIKSYKVFPCSVEVDPQDQRVTGWSETTIEDIQ